MKRLLFSSRSICTSLLALAAVPTLALGEASYSTGFGDGGWRSDDTRNAAGENLIAPGVVHFPTEVNAVDDLGQLQAQIRWQNYFGSRGNLGGVALTGGDHGNTKSTISQINVDDGFGLTHEVFNESLSIVYRWAQLNNNQGPGFRIGIRSNFYESDTSNLPNPIPRSGEGAWDLILTAPAAGSGVRLQTLDFATTEWHVFQRAGGTFFNDTTRVTEGGVTLSDLAAGNFLFSGEPTGPMSPGDQAMWDARRETLMEALFGTSPGVNEAKVTNVQFGLGSGQVGGDGLVDWARISFVDDGKLIDFAADNLSFWTGDSVGGDFFDAGNWDGPLPSATQNALFDGSAGTVTVSGTGREARSIGAVAGETQLELAPGSDLTLKDNGFLFAESGATLTVAGGEGSHVIASTVEAWGGNDPSEKGRVVLSTKVTLHGGLDALGNPLPQSGRGGLYGLVVGTGAEVEIAEGAEVAVRNPGGGAHVRVGESDGLITAKGVLKVTGGSLTIAGEDHAGSLFVGDWGAEGEVDQQGGTVTLTGSFNVGNQGGKGSYNISSGTLNLMSGLYSLGRNNYNSASTASQGTLRISGDGLVDLHGGTFYASNREAGGTSPGGTGLIEQSGGTLRVRSGAAALYLAGYGNVDGLDSRYTLSGGVLEVAGDRFRARQSGTTGEYLFELGGGTVRAYESAMSTSVAATLLDSTTSTLDSNGLGMTWAGVLSGGGSLNKSGDGTLILSGLNTYSGQTLVSAGRLQVNTQTGSGAVIVSQGASLGGNGLIKGAATIHGALNPGNSPGMLTFEAGLTLSTTSVTTLEINGTGTGQYDRITVSGGIFEIEGGELRLQLASLSDGDYVLDLFENASSILGEFDSVAIYDQLGVERFALSLGGGSWGLSTQVGSVVYNFGFETASGTFSYQVGEDYLAVPEPGTYALLVGAGAALWMASRRRRMA